MLSLFNSLRSSGSAAGTDPSDEAPGREVAERLRGPGPVALNSSEVLLRDPRNYVGPAGSLPSPRCAGKGGIQTPCEGQIDAGGPTRLSTAGTARRFAANPGRSPLPRGSSSGLSARA
jgi:hypothetical protein